MSQVISVIVPVYNVEKYLNKCVDSILSQTYTNLEIILVDDGSTDNCGAICDEYANRDKRIIVIHKENAGLGCARNSGLEICSGEYIMFVDSDDYLSEEAIEVLYQRIINDGSDIAIGKHVETYENGRINDIRWKVEKNTTMVPEEIFGKMSDTVYLPVAAWGKLYKRKLIKNIRYPSITIGEDLWVFPYIVEKCKTVSIDTTVIYYYLQRSNSLMKQKSEKSKIDHAKVMLHTTEYFYKKGYLQVAKSWYKQAIGRAFLIKERKRRTSLFDEYFDEATKRELLKGANLRTQIKWLCLHLPFIYYLRLGIKFFKSKSYSVS